MARDFDIPGECLVRVKGATGSAIANLSELGLSTDQIQVSPQMYHDPIVVNAWGKAIPETQFMLASAVITMNLIHYDVAILDECVRLSMGAPTTVGQVARAGSRLGNNAARFAATNYFIGLNLSSPMNARPWRFLYTHILGQPRYPLGIEKSIVSLTWQAVLYTTDPWQSGSGAANQALWDRTPDT